jgi:predicted TIM-barrel fold metal-dependent hydrolase
MKLVMSHAGVGFGGLALAIAQRHPNVYLEFSAIKPRHLPAPFIKAINSYLRDRVLFGSDYPLIEFSIVEEWKKIVDEKNHDRFFHDNAAQLLGL